MSKIKNGGLDKYGAKPSEQQQFGTVGVEGVNESVPVWTHLSHNVTYSTFVGPSTGVQRRTALE